MEVISAVLVVASLISFAIGYFWVKSGKKIPDFF